jgi:D-arginine dehydrogenase
MTDFLVVGGGIAGAAAGYFLSEHGLVTLVEAEDVPGRHSTGRSAALYSEYFGNAVVRALTAASRAFFTDPPSDFADAPLLRRRGVLVLARHGQEREFAEAVDVGLSTLAGVRKLTRAQARRLFPVLRADACDRALLRVGAADLDVAAVHQGFLRGIRRNGGQVEVNARVESIVRQADLWNVTTSSGRVEAPVLINAAGAWAEQVAGMAGVGSMGLLTRRRTLALVPTPRGHRIDDWPMLTDLGSTFYAKPEAGGLLVSPQDDTVTVPGDPQAEDIDVATAIARYEAVTTEPVRRVITSWAGLRTAAPDDSPVVGPAPDAPGFFWLAGLSGYGIQLAPAVASLLASLVMGEDAPGVHGDVLAAVRPAGRRREPAAS